MKAKIATLVIGAILATSAQAMSDKTRKGYCSVWVMSIETAVYEAKSARFSNNVRRYNKAVNDFQSYVSSFNDMNCHNILSSSEMARARTAVNNF